MTKKWQDRYQQIPAARRASIEAEVATALQELPLHQLRKARQLSQEQLAEVLGEKQASISKLEQRTDMYLSTLRKYVEALGGELVIAVRFPAGAIQIQQFEEPKERLILAPKSKLVKGSRNTPGRKGNHMSAPPKSQRNSGKEWSAAEVKQLKELAKGNTPTRVIGIKLGRTPEAVRTRASNEGVSLKPTNQSPYNRKKK